MSVYIVTAHAFKRFKEHHQEFYRKMKLDDYKELFVECLKVSKPCHISPNKYKNKLIKYDLIQNVNSLYRYGKAWTFIIVKSGDFYYVITAIYRISPRPKILDIKSPIGEVKFNS